MKKYISISLMMAPLTGLLIAATALAAPPEPKVTICHKYGTEDQATLDVGYPAMSAHLANHGDWTGACPESDLFVDVDGKATVESGLPLGIQVAVGDSLTPWPTPGLFPEGIDHFDNDGDCTWSDGDDLHLERPANCATAVSQGIHDSGEDCVVLDVDGSLYDGQQVDIDLETGLPFTGCPGPDPQLMFYDANGSGAYDNGEDIVYDANGDGTFN